jgi:hypothetical protein
MTGYPTYVGRMSVSCLTALELFAMHNTCRSERAPDLIVLLIDHTKLGIHCGRTRNDSSDANAKVHQHRNAHPYRAPTIGEAHHAGLIFKLFAQAVSLRMAHLKSLSSLSSSVQSSWRPLNDEKQEREETTALKDRTSLLFPPVDKGERPFALPLRPAPACSRTNRVARHSCCWPLPPAAEEAGFSLCRCCGPVLLIGKALPAALESRLEEVPPRMIHCHKKIVAARKQLRPSWKLDDDGR